jgi:hypothetical protein
MELQLFPITEVYGGLLWYPLERDGEVLAAWRELTYADPPDELTTIGRFLSFPPLPEVPQQMRGKSFVIVEAYHVGERAQAHELLAPLRALGPVDDTIDTVPISAIPHMHLDPEQPAAGLGDGLLLTELPPEALDALICVAGAGAMDPLLTVEVRQLGGEFGRARPENGAPAAVPAP